MDLTPRDDGGGDVPSAPPVRRRGRRWPAMVVLVLVVSGGGVLVTQFLGSAIDYYCNVDEIGTRAGCDAGRRLRVQGNVEEGSVQSEGGVTTFLISFNGVEMPVRYQGQPGGIFQECVPVVVHGRVDESTGADGTLVRVFQGDTVEVKHSNEYTAQHGDRIDEAQDACSLQA